MNKAIIKKFLIYFILRNIPIMLIVFGFMNNEQVWVYIVNLFKSNLLSTILFFILPVTLFNALLFVWPYAYLLKHFKEGRRMAFIWYWIGLLMVEAILLKVSIYEDMPLLLVIVVFTYLVVFTWVFFRKEIRERDTTFPVVEDD